MALGEACEVNPRKPNLTGIADDTTVMFVPMAAVDEVDGTIAAAEDRTLRDVKSKSYRTFAPGDVLFAKITPCMENGKSAIVPDVSSGLGFGSTEFHVLRPKRGVDPHFIWHFVRQERFRRLAEEHMTGSVGQLRVPASFLENFPITLPDAQTQARIARLLDRAGDASKSARRRLAAARRATARFRQAILAAAFSGRLTADWREKHSSSEDGKALLEAIVHARRERSVSNAESPKTGTLELTGPPLQPYELPPGWSWAIWNDLEDWITYGFTRPMPHVEDGIPIVTAKNVSGGRIDFANVAFTTEEAFAELSQKDIPRPGELLLTKDGSIGRVAVVPEGRRFCVNQSVAVIRFGGLSAEGTFLRYLIEAPLTQALVQEAARGSAIQHIAITAFGRLPVPVPPLEEQCEIVRRVDQLMTLADGLRERIETAGRHLERSSQSILAKAFRGDLMV